MSEVVETPVSRHAGKLLSAIWVALSVDYMLLTVIVPIIPRYLDDLGVSQVAIGALFATKGVCQIIANPFWGALADRGSPILVLFLGLLVLIGSTVVYALGTTYWVLVMARSIQGVGSAAIMTASMGSLSLVYSGEQRGEAMGIAMSGVGMGVIVGPSLGGLAFVGTALGKGLPMIILASILTLDFLWLLYLRFLLSNQEDSCNVQGVFMMGLSDEPDSEKSPTSLLTLLKDTKVLAILVTLCLADSAIALSEPILPQFFTDEYNVPSGFTGMVFATASFSYAVFNPLVGKHGEKYDRRKGIALGLVILATALAFIGIAPNLGVEILLLLLMGCGMAFVDSSTMPLLASIVDEKYENAYSSLFALSDMALSVGYVIGPLAGTAAEQHLGLFHTLLIYACVLPLLVIVLLFVGGKPPAPEESHLLKNAA